MKKVEVVPTFKKAFFCVVSRPKVMVPFLAFFLFFMLIFVSAFYRVFKFAFFMAPGEEMPLQYANEIFGFIGFILLAIFFLLVGYPFVEGWTYAALGSAYQHQPVSLIKTAKRALSKYFGMLGITIIVAIVQSMISSLISFVIFFATIPSMMEETFFPDPLSSQPVPEPVFPSSFFTWYFVIYGVSLVVVSVVMVLFIYLKPAYVLKDNQFAVALRDGFDTVKRNFVPSYLILLFFTSMPVLIFGAFQTLIFSEMLDETFMYGSPSEIQALLQSYGETLMGAAIIAGLIWFFLYVVQYAAFTYAYMDANEMLEKK